MEHAQLTQSEALNRLFDEGDTILCKHIVEDDPTLYNGNRAHIITKQYIVMNPFLPGTTTKEKTNIARLCAFTIEHDTVNKDLQKEWFYAILPEGPTCAVDSGNKSIHYTITINRSITEKERTVLSEELKKAFPVCDHGVITDASKLVRTPGGTRANGAHQEILSIGKRYDYQELLDRLKLMNQGYLHSISSKCNNAFDDSKSEKVKLTKPEAINELVSLGYDPSAGFLYKSIKFEGIDDCIKDAKAELFFERQRPIKKKPLPGNADNWKVRLYDADVDPVKFFSDYGIDGILYKGNNRYKGFTEGQHSHNKAPGFNMCEGGAWYSHYHGQGGHPVAWIMLYRGISQIEAEKELAAYLGIDSKNYCKYCKEAIAWIEKKPHNTDGTKHNCRQEKRKETIASTPWAIEDKKGKITINTGICSNVMFEEFDGDLVYSKNDFWNWNGKVWEKKDESADIKSKIRAYIQSKVGDGPITIAKIKDINDQIALQAYKKTDFDMNKDYIVLQNGNLNIKKNKLLAFDRDLYQSIILPFEYDKNAFCWRWLKFLSELDFSKETIERLQEWFGYCLVPDTRIEKCLYLIGGGSNGKSVILDTLGALLEGNTSSLEPLSMFERFQLLGLKGKLVNYCTDISTKGALSEQFKKAVSGEAFTCDVKGKDHVTFKPFARHLFSSNEWLPTRDRSHGFFRRFDILQFNRCFNEQDKDEGLKDYIKDNELPEIFNWALTGLQRLISNKYKMTISEEFENTKKVFKEESNPLAQFIEERCFTIEDPALKETHADEINIIIRAYTDWCTDNNYKPLSKVHFGRQLTQLNEGDINSFNKSRISRAGKRIHIYNGLRLLTHKELFS